MAGFCSKCGAALQDGDMFCLQCGQKVEGVSPAPPAPAVHAPPAPAAPRKRSFKGLIVALACALAVAALVLVYLLTPGLQSLFNPFELSPVPASLQAGETTPSVQCKYDAPDVIIPAVYRSIDYIVFLQCWTDHGETDVLVTVEIPGFTQKYEQKVTVSRAETQLKIHPPIAEGAAKTLNSSKNAQLVVSVKESRTGNVILQDSRPVKLYSRYDMLWQSQDGTPYYENFLAWVTPEAPEIKQLLRTSADSLSFLTNGAMKSMVGYQQVGTYAAKDITYAQACAVMYTMASQYAVKYVATPFSSTSTELQRVATPAEVLNNSAGLCCETAATVASALQAMNMHAVLILLPGHMQAAVETWYNSGEYILIETTALDAAATGTYENFSKYVAYPYSKDQWRQYVNQEGVEVIDCDLAIPLQIQSID